MKAPLAATSIGMSVQALHQFGLLKSWVGESSLRRR